MPDILYQKPLLGQQINWVHPLAKGLKIALTMNEYGGITTFDYASFNRYAFAGASTAWNPDGIYFTGNGSGISAGIDLSSFFNSEQGTIVQSYIRLSAVTQFAVFCQVENVANNLPDEFQWQIHDASAVKFQPNADEAQDHWLFTADYTVYYPVGTRVVNAIKWNRSQTIMQGYKNGVPDGSQQGGAWGAANWNSTARLDVGGRPTSHAGTDFSCNGILEYWYYYEDYLSDEAINDLYKFPYAMFQQNRVRRFSVGGAALTASIADTVGVSDDLATVGTFIKVLADTLGITDTINTARNLKIALADNTGITDTTITSKSAVRSIADSVGITDTIATIKGAVRSIADSVGITDVLSKIGTFIKSFSDPVGVTDAITTSKGAVRSIDDSVGITDVLTKIGTYIRSVVDSVGVSDVLSKTGTYKRSVMDTTGITDTITTSKGVTRSIADSVGITDVLSTLLIRVVSIADTVGITDVITYIKTVVVTPFIDSISAVSGIVKSISTDSGMTKSQSKKSEINKNITGDSEL